jgi:hypothetical protein
VQPRATLPFHTAVGCHCRHPLGLYTVILLSLSAKIIVSPSARYAPVGAPAAAVGEAGPDTWAVGQRVWCEPSPLSRGPLYITIRTNPGRKRRPAQWQ